MQPLEKCTNHAVSVTTSILCQSLISGLPFLYYKSLYHYIHATVTTTSCTQQVSALPKHTFYFPLSFCRLTTPHTYKKVKYTAELLLVYKNWATLGRQLLIYCTMCSNLSCTVVSLGMVLLSIVKAWVRVCYIDVPVLVCHHYFAIAHP